MSKAPQAVGPCPDPGTTRARPTPLIRADVVTRECRRMLQNTKQLVYLKANEGAGGQKGSEGGGGDDVFQ